MSEDSQYVIIQDPQTCVDASVKAHRMELKAMHADSKGQVGEAIDCYRQAVVGFREATNLCPEGHPDQKVLEVHVDEVLARALYLEHEAGNVVRLPLEEHIHSAQLTLGHMELSLQDSRSPSRTKVMGAAAMLSGAAGLLLVGPIAGAALGAATAYATTREDQAGSAARRVGRVGVKLVDQATTMEKEHRISQRVVAVSLTATDKATQAMGWGFYSAKLALKNAIL